MRLIKPAIHDARIFGGSIGGRFRGFSRRWRLRWRLRPRLPGFLENRLGRRPGEGFLGCRGGLRRVLIGPAMSNKFLIARSAGPRRNVIGHAAGPMRPVIGNVAGKSAFGRAAAGPKEWSGTGQDSRRNPSFDDHGRRRIFASARGSHRAPLTILSDRVAVQ